MKFAYYPGCSLHATAAEFAQSLAAVLPRLGVTLQEIDDWSCCGSSSAHAESHLLSIALPARNLALAEEQGQSEILAPCAACFSRLAAARQEMAADAALRDKVNKILQRPFRNSVAVLNLADLMQRLIPAIREKATRPLRGLKIACYYGCLLLRPPAVAQFDDPEQPTSMEQVTEACGASAVAWNKKIDCCGGFFSLARTGSVIRLGREILQDARAAGAQAIVTACPMCQSNLDLRQQAMNRRGEKPFHLPILYLSQLVGLALGMAPRELGLDRHFVDSEDLFQQLTQPAAQAAAGGNG